MIVKNYKKFLILISISLLFINIIYFTIFDLMVEKDDIISSSYQQFLLENTSSPRLIIESGSNSKFSLDSKMLSKELNISVVNIADNAGNALRQKLLRLIHYSKSGDIILLPLEWKYYSFNKLTIPFTERIFTPYHYYYTNLSLIERVKLIYKIPFSSLRKRLQSIWKNKEEKDKTLIEFIRLKRHIKRYAKGERGEVEEQYNFTAKKLITEGVKNCYDYIFLMQIKNNFSISNGFKNDLKLVKILQKKGVHVLFTWPTVVGEDCYKIKYRKEIDKFSEEIRKFLVKNNIPIMGNIKDGEFSEEYIFNTFYHVQHKARLMHTQQIIKDILKSPYAKWFPKESNIENINFDALYNTLSKKINDNLSNNRKNRTIFLSGWYEKENWGRWSNGESSALLLLIKKESRHKEIKLKIKARVYGVNRKITLSANGHNLGNFNLKGKHSITIPPLNKSIIEIKFNYSQVKSPNELEPNSHDFRKIKLGIESIKIEN